MVDIAGALSRLADVIMSRNFLKKTNIISSFTVTPATSGQSITNSIAPTGMKVFYVSLKVRSMGTASYIAIGSAGNLEERLTVVGELYEAEAPKGAYLDTRDLFIRADVGDAVIEVGGVLIPEGAEER